MKQVQIGTHKFTFATSWSETTAEQKLALLPLQLLDDPAQPGKMALLKFAAAKVLLGASDDQLEPLDEYQRHRLMRLAIWVFTTRIQSLPFEWFSFKGVDYHLPADGFSNASAVEVAMANIYYIHYTRKESPDLSAVYKLIATLCRPVRKDIKQFRASIDWNKDVREPYNGALADDRAKAFQEGEFPIGQAMAILQFFEFTNNNFLSAYKSVYQSDGDDRPPLYTDGTGLITTFMDIAKTGTFGDFENVCKQNCHTVWLFLKDNNLKVHQAQQEAEKANDN